MPLRCALLEFLTISQAAQADPGLQNARESQRPQTRLVDISYDLTSTAAAANGSFLIDSVSGLANVNVAYSWSQGAWRLTREGGVNADQWRIHNNGTTYFLDINRTNHPVLVTSWTASNGSSGNLRIQAPEALHSGLRTYARMFVSSLSS